MTDILLTPDEIKIARCLTGEQIRECIKSVDITEGDEDFQELLLMALHCQSERNIAKAAVRKVLEWLEGTCTHNKRYEVYKRRGCRKCMADARRKVGLE